MVLGLPAPYASVRVAPAAVRMKRLQQEAALLGIPRDNQSRERRIGPLRLFVIPGLAVLRRWSESHEATVMTLGAPDVPFARVGKHLLDARTEEREVQRGFGSGHVPIGGQTLDPA